MGYQLHVAYGRQSVARIDLSLCWICCTKQRPLLKITMMSCRASHVECPTFFASLSALAAAGALAFSALAASFASFAFFAASLASCRRVRESRSHATSKCRCRRCTMHSLHRGSGQVHRASQCMVMMWSS
jgi:hypothetical protein